MASKTLFKSATKGITPPPTNTVNEAGGKAFKMGGEHALAQLAATGTMADAFYVTADQQLAKAMELARSLEPTYVAKTAVFARERGFMKDMPALLAAVLMSRGETDLLKKIFPRVIDNGKMLRNFVQIVRSGQTGRKSLGSAAKNLVLNWVYNQSIKGLLIASIGNDPSLGDIIDMVRPNPSKSRFVQEALKRGDTEGARKLEREFYAMYGYLAEFGRYNSDELPQLVKDFETFKTNKGDASAIPDVPFDMLTSLPLAPQHWKQIAKSMSWTQLRINLNTLSRHKVFDDPQLVKEVAAKLSSEELVNKAKVFPYQLLVAFRSVEGVPPELTLALQDAMEASTKNVPAVDGKVFVFPDVSGSMSSPVTGFRGTATTAARCIDIAALVASVFMRQNQATEVIPFETGVISTSRLSLNPRDSVMTNATKLASIGGGGTNCVAPLAALNARKAKGDLIVYVSDNESWFDPEGKRYHSTGVAHEWAEFKSRNPKAKMVCIDIQANTTTQILDGKDVLNVGGFSDQVFETIAKFVKGELTEENWVGMVKAVQL